MRALALLALAGCMVEEVTTAEVASEVAVCADGPTTYGIDVSRFQGDINWQLVANSGVKYAFIQISRSLTDIDVKFPYNWKRAKEVGILRGAYQRFQPGQDVIGQAELFVEKLGPYQPGDLPPVLDVEDANGLTPAQIRTRVKQWLDYVELHVGVKPIIYTGYYFWKDNVGSSDIFKQYPLWIANYSATCPLVPAPWPKWTLHQYSSSAMIPGITANTVDVNRFNGTLAELVALGKVPEVKPCAMIVAAPEMENIVDDTSACFEAGGDPAYIRQAAAGIGDSLKWTHATDAATPSNFGRWQLQFAEAGRYRVEAFTPAPYNGSTKTIYQVRHGDVVTPAAVDQSAVDGWNLVGDFEFAAGDGQSIRVDDNTGEANATNTKIVFDALRFTRVDDVPLGEQPPVDEPTAGGCSTSRGAGWFCVVLLVLVIRRRR